MCSIIVPLYIYPRQDHIRHVWSPLLQAISRYPGQRFIVIINPGSGPGERPLPDLSYQAAIPLLKGENVTILGYVSANYGNRELSKLLGDMDTYYKWENYGLGIDGLFIDEVDFEGHKFSFFEEISRTVRSKVWRQRTGYLCLNPGGPTSSRYFDLADLVIVSEHAYHDFINPPTQYDTYNYLLDTPSTYGRKVLLPRFTTETPAPRMGVIMHGFAAQRSFENRLQEMRSMTQDLVKVKKLGAVFITDLEIGKGDVYSQFSSIWEQFVETVVELNETVAVEVEEAPKTIVRMGMKNGFIAGFVAKIIEMRKGRECNVP